MLDEMMLRRLYIDEEHTLREIAELTGMAQATILRAMMRYRIPRRPSNTRPRRNRFEKRSAQRTQLSGFDREMLRRVYEDDGQSLETIAALLQCAPTTVRKALIDWGIPRRRRGRPNH